MTEAITPEMLMLLDLFDAVRKHFGPEDCKDNWVGRMRRANGKKIPAGVSQFPAASPAIAEYVAARQTATAVLRLHCQNCGRCELGKE